MLRCAEPSGFRHNPRVDPSPPNRIAVSAEPQLRVPVAFCRELSRRVRRAAHRVGPSRGRLHSLAIRIVGDAEMTRLHENYYGEKGTTDVLSFGSDAPEELGDIALGWSALCSDGASIDVALHRACVLSVHGLAHLLGHDHRFRSEARAMLRAEVRGLRALGIDDAERPYGR